MPTAASIENTVKCPHCGKKHVISESRNNHILIVCKCKTVMCVTAGYRSIQPVVSRRVTAAEIIKNEKRSMIGMSALVKSAQRQCHNFINKHNI